jgi:hypothetical protein
MSTCEPTRCTTRLILVIALMMGGALASTTAAAQTNAGEIQGVVKDGQGAVGRYSISVILEGFKTASVEITLSVGQRLDVPIELKVGDRAETVTVVATQTLLQTANAEVRDIINTQQVISAAVERPAISAARAAE